MSDAAEPTPDEQKAAAERRRDKADSRLRTLTIGVLVLVAVLSLIGNVVQQVTLNRISDNQETNGRTLEIVQSVTDPGSCRAAQSDYRLAAAIIALQNDNRLIHGLELRPVPPPPPACAPDEPGVSSVTKPPAGDSLPETDHGGPK